MKSIIIHPRQWLFSLISLTLVSLAGPLAAQPRVVIHNQVVDANFGYGAGLLELGLSYFPGKYQLRESDEFYGQARMIQEFDSGQLDVLWVGTNADFERRFRPIRIPLFKGLLGHRLFIIRQGDQARFDRVRSLEQLKQIPVGQGRTWADTEILRSAGLEVLTTNKYVNLFPMLEGGRFDAFPRGAHEPWAEVRDWAHLDLTVEEGLMLVYRMPLYFFVGHQDRELARDLEEGLNRAIADGSFDKHFFGHELVRDVLRQANLQDRRAFFIDNPNMTPETPVDRDELWLDISNLPEE